jgi:hypothetical protein
LTNSNSPTRIGAVNGIAFPKTLKEALGKGKKIFWF